MEFFQCESTKSYFVLLHLEIVSQGHHDERIKADKKEKSRIEIGEYHVKCYSMYSTLGKRPFPPDRSCRQGKGARELLAAGFGSLRDQPRGPSNVWV